jgi:hypothetical protein
MGPPEGQSLHPPRPRSATVSSGIRTSIAAAEKATDEVVPEDSGLPGPPTAKTMQSVVIRHLDWTPIQARPAVNRVPTRSPRLQGHPRTRLTASTRPHRYNPSRLRCAPPGCFACLLTTHFRTRAVVTFGLVIRCGVLVLAPGRACGGDVHAFAVTQGRIVVDNLGRSGHHSGDSDRQPMTDAHSSRAICGSGSSHRVSQPVMPSPPCWDGYGVVLGCKKQPFVQFCAHDLFRLLIR